VNLYYPDKATLNGVPINSNLRVQKDADSFDTKYLTGELFHAFGTVFDVPQEGEDF
jgi:hypothetical protein